LFFMALSRSEDKKVKDLKSILLIDNYRFWKPLRFIKINLNDMICRYAYLSLSKIKKSIVYLTYFFFVYGGRVRDGSGILFIAPCAVCWFGAIKR
jgi:hypothetical protein